MLEGKPDLTGRTTRRGLLARAGAAALGMVGWLALKPKEARAHFRHVFCCHLYYPANCAACTTCGSGYNRYLWYCNISIANYTCLECNPVLGSGKVGCSRACAF